MVLASDWYRVITWPGYWPLIGQELQRRRKHQYWSHKLLIKHDKSNCISVLSFVHCSRVMCYYIILTKRFLHLNKDDPSEIIIIIISNKTKSSPKVTKKRRLHRSSWLSLEKCDRDATHDSLIRGKTMQWLQGAGLETRGAFRSIQKEYAGAYRTRHFAENQENRRFELRGSQKLWKMEISDK